MTGTGAVLWIVLPFQNPVYAGASTCVRAKLSEANFWEVWAPCPVSGANFCEAWTLAEKIDCDEVAERAGASGVGASG